MTNLENILKQAKQVPNRQKGDLYIGLDLDDCVNYANNFFSAITHGVEETHYQSENKAYIIMITGRRECHREMTEDLLKKLNVRYDYLLMYDKEKSECDVPEWKGRLAKWLDLDVFIDNSRENINAVYKYSPRTVCFQRLSPNDAGNNNEQ